MSSSTVRIAVAVVEHDGQFLVGQRPDGVALAGYWEFPGGKILAGESAEAAAVRECLEETVLAVRIVGSYPTALHAYDHGRLELNFFACRPLDLTTTPQAPFRWIPRADLGRFRFPPANAELISILLRDGAY